MTGDSSEEKPHVGVVSLVTPDGPLTTVVSGRVVSTRNVRVVAAPVLPTVSTARTWNVRAPSTRAAVVCGDVQPANAAPSTRHSNVAPASEEKAKVGVLSLVAPVGPLLIVTAGAVMSITIARLAGAPGLPAASVARISTVWLPSLRTTE